MFDVAHALDAGSGAPLAALPIGMAISGPAVSRGHVCIGTGDDLIGDPSPPTRILPLRLGDD